MGILYPYFPYTYDEPKPEKFIQVDLAKSLKSISEGGRDAFYKGWIADAIADEMSEHNGLISREDLAMYEPIVSKPELGNYRKHEILYDPTHGGTTLVEMLNILEGYDLAGYGFGSPEYLHLVGDSIGLAYSDRFVYGRSRLGQCAPESARFEELCC